MAGKCRSCGQEMVSETDHAGDDIDCEYCAYCADHNCNLKTRDAVERSLRSRVAEEHPDASDDQIREHVRRQLDEMPAWK